MRFLLQGNTLQDVSIDLLHGYQSYHRILISLFFFEKRRATTVA
jgi:hypothetical protein